MLCYAQDLPGYTSQQKGKNYGKYQEAYHGSFNFDQRHYTGRAH
jgi:hypothetical protein